MQDDPTRLLALVSEGDRSAAERLQVLAERTGDAALQRTAALGLRDHVHAGRLAAALWDAGDLGALVDYAREWGVESTPALWETITLLMEQTNGSRRVRLLGRDVVLAALFEARHTSEPFVYVTGGVRSSGTHGARTSACLVVPAVRDGETVLTLGLAEAAASASEPPRVWSDELRPWRKDMSRNLERLAAWAAHGTEDRIVLTTAAPAVDAPSQPEPTLDDQLDAHLQAEPSREAFDALVTLLDAADDTSAVARAERTLDPTWPPETRVANKRTVDRILKGRTSRDTDALYRHAHIAGPSPDALTRLTGTPLAARLECLTLESARSGVDEVDYTGLHGQSGFERLHTLQVLGRIQRTDGLAALIEADGLPALRTLRLGTYGALLPAVAQPAILYTLEHLELVAAPWMRASLGKRALRALLAGDAVRNLRELTVHSSVILDVDQLLTTLADNIHLTNLTRLTLVDVMSIHDAALAALARFAFERLELHAHKLEPDGLVELLSGPSRHSLRVVGLEAPMFERSLLDALAGADAIEHLEVRRNVDFGRSLRTPTWDGDDVDAISGAAWWPSLQTLVIRHISLTAEAIARMLGTLQPGHLRRLELHDCALDAGAVTALASCAALNGLEVLDLSHSPMGDAGFAALIASPHLTALRTLGVPRCELGLDGVRALVDSSALPALRHLDLRTCDVGRKGARMLEQSAALARLERLDLTHTGIPAAARRALLKSRFLAGRIVGLPEVGGAN